MSSSSSISSSLRLFTTKLPTNSSFAPKTLSAFPKNPNFTSFTRPFTFQRIPTISSSSTSSPSTPLQPIEELPPKLLEIVNLFQSVPVAKAKYEELLFYGKNLKPLEDKYKTKDNKVEGCVSQVWVRAYLDSDNNVVFEADSDAQIAKGLAALLVKGLSGQPVEEVLRVRPDFVLHLGLQQSLSPGRNNGFLNMLKLMQKKAKQLISESDTVDLGLNSELSSVEFSTSGSKINGGLSSIENAEQLSGSTEKNSNSGLKIGDGNNEASLEGNGEELEVVESVSNEEELNSGGLGGRGKRIKEALERELSPVELEVEDISYQHAGHAGVRGSGDGETHFNVRVVSKEFEGKSLIKRHRLIYALLQEELDSGLHALSIEAKTPAEVNAK
ncbi:sufE-like protein 1, chloroplastic/mitochondrial [Argentina anserina]|uniref:sufE-like protein 1, chloroplastic/mitochondrial n=1 Tax=Argentina anserina TaxID=57926 RepID=UPI0021764FAB|nr:sufE-like protein 1, chloroplastic/mitochondrial [Potentilla anserina]